MYICMYGWWWWWCSSLSEWEHGRMFLCTMYTRQWVNRIAGGNGSASRDGTGTRWLPLPISYPFVTHFGSILSSSQNTSTVDGPFLPASTRLHPFVLRPSPSRLGDGTQRTTRCKSAPPSLTNVGTYLHITYLQFLQVVRKVG